MTPIFAVILAAPIVLGITVLIYMFCYRRKINRRLAEGSIAEKRKGKPMMPPIVFVLVTIICVSIVTALLVIAISYFSINTFTTSRSNGGFDRESLIDMRMIHEEDLEDSLFEGYKTGDNIAGYTMHKQESGDLTFYYYMINANMQGILPRLIIATEASGDTSGLCHGISINAKEGFKTLGISGGSKFYMCAIECTEFEGDLKIKEYYYDEEYLGEKYDIQYESARYKGTIELDMSYTEPEE
ncbi:hypothetical protein [Ruminococcus albus]|uniref:Uncharacterized protein n=1 Tax=Ruminococcus albus TaxID=1264 RepID=A0A1I1IIU5_RUMAL|nr:hypothetical protein [Ruminococcus albus]SFC36204.1 hypothetical protein SAMN02910406_01603 [Ruminococcus albus]